MAFFDAFDEGLFAGVHFYGEFVEEFLGLVGVVFFPVVDGGSGGFEGGFEDVAGGAGDGLDELDDKGNESGDEHQDWYEGEDQKEASDAVDGEAGAFELGALTLVKPLIEVVAPVGEVVVGLAEIGGYLRRGGGGGSRWADAVAEGIGDGIGGGGGVGGGEFAVEVFGGGFDVFGDGVNDGGAHFILKDALALHQPAAGEKRDEGDEGKGSFIFWLFHV